MIGGALDTKDSAQPSQRAGSAPGIRRRLARSNHPVAAALKRIYRYPHTFSLPIPAAAFRPVLWVYIFLRSCLYFVLRVFVAEPLFRAYCKKVGRGFHTDIYVHWVKGKGDIILGDNVSIGGRCNFSFGARFADRPVLEVGDNSGIGSSCVFIIGKRITIGSNCRLSGNVLVLDSSGHPVDADARIAGHPPTEDEVRPVKIGDRVWIGQHCIIMPGVRIGEGAVIAAGSVVRTHLPPYCVAAGNPARVVLRLKRPASDPLDCPDKSEETAV